MSVLFDELVALACRFEEEYDCAFEEDCPENELFIHENEPVRAELEAFIVKLAAPKTVGDVMRLPLENLRCGGFIYLIEKDACDKYEQIDGYADFVICDNEELEAALTPSQYGLNGAGLCEWIDRMFPVDAAA